MKDFSVFVSHWNVKGKVDGVVHISATHQDRVNHPADLLSRGQSVKVKDVSVQGTRIGLSMKDVDQNTGDLDPAKRIASGATLDKLDGTGSKAISAADYPDIDEEHHTTLTGEWRFREEEDVDIEVHGEEPPFLAGQTRQSLEISPIRVVKAPDRSLNSAAIGGTALAKKRRELRQQQAADVTVEEAQKVNLNAQWQDPILVRG
ncbi:hypothetical protein C7212DRAFT_343487 [Tuber magnatum]|uniref:S1 motif domain-containing protein n=1 Tax=Tuber magnatum TaxID=42249 RepID=A0A317SU36_9PEZI|nr:hypothetical protein C7212DRAFT_343487 [Tuber magnatum]